MLTTVCVSVGYHYERGPRTGLCLKVTSYASPYQWWPASWGPQLWVQFFWHGPLSMARGTSCQRSAACSQYVPVSCNEDCSPARTLGMDHLKEMAPGAFSFCKLFSLATRRFIRKGISKYCVLYCRKTALALNWKSLKNGYQSFDIRRQWSILIWLQLPSGMVCLSFYPLYEGYYRAHHLQQTWLLWTIGYSGQKLISQTKHIKSNTFFIGYNRQKPWFRLTLSRDFNDITIGLQRGKGRMAGIKWGQGTPEVSFPTK